MAEEVRYGPTNPHPLSTRRTELVWEGKYDEYGNRREVDIAGMAMPLQKIETVDEPRSRAEGQGKLFDHEQAHRDDFRNMLIWGDNKLVTASLLKDFRGKVDLIYIDPPFDVGADFTMSLSIGDGKDSVEKEQSVLEAVAYRDMWGRGTDSYLHMMFERLSLMRELLSESGSIFVHLGVQVNHLVRVLLEEVFGRENEIDEIIWSYGTPSGCRAAANKIIKAHEYVVAYAKSYGAHTYNKVFLPYSQKYIADWFKWQDADGRRYQQRMRGRDSKGESVWEKQYLDESKGNPLSSVWTDIQQVYADPRAYKLGM
jgi:adenine-specific DNA-methyltransferase